MSEIVFCVVFCGCVLLCMLRVVYASVMSCHVLCVLSARVSGLCVVFQYWAMRCVHCVGG